MLGVLGLVRCHDIDEWTEHVIGDARFSDESVSLEESRNKLRKQKILCNKGAEQIYSEKRRVHLWKRMTKRKKKPKQNPTTNEIVKGN